MPDQARASVYQNGDAWRVTTYSSEFANGWCVGIDFPTERAARIVAEAIESAARGDYEPARYRCTVLLEMPPDDGSNTRPEDVTEILTGVDVCVVEWHDEDLISQKDDRS
jgi:hypothetical protein